MSPGEVWLADLGIAAKTRPVVVVSRADGNPPRQIVIVVPLTSQIRGSSYEADLGKAPYLREVSVANTQGILSIPKVRLLKKLGQLEPKKLEEVKKSLRFAMDL